jgi:predicted nucleotidyltransferase
MGSSAAETSIDRELLAAFRRRIVAAIEADLRREDAEAEARRAQVIPMVARIVTVARAAQQCGRAWLFGSFAWGRPEERSDIDLLVEDCPDPDALAADIWRAAERPAHVIPVDRAERSLIERALAEGRPL